MLIKFPSQCVLLLILPAVLLSCAAPVDVDTKQTAYSALESSATQPPPLQIAFMPDIHFHDIYATFNHGAFQGLTNSVSGKNATIRTLSAELNSTRLFNENYFAVLAALDDVVARGIKLVALPGDFSDDGQPIHLRGLVAVLKYYEQQYGMQFFAAPGNHDPVRPFDYPGGKEDFLGQGGQQQSIYSLASKACQSVSSDVIQSNKPKTLPVICTDDIRHLGYQGMMSLLSGVGFYPQAQYRYWASPYSDYSPNSYDFAKALKQAELTQRQYEICAQGMGGKAKPAYYHSCTQVPDASYVVEPIEGLWLLAIDANVYVPKANSSQSNDLHQSVNFNGSGNAGYNLMLSHKTHVIEWIKQVVEQAKQRGKQLVAFSHFPMSEFYDGQSDAIGHLFGEDKLQLGRRPQDKASQVLAETGIKIHVGGHMHINDTGFSETPNGQFLFNIQAPSIAAYVPAYKVLTLKKDQQVEVETVVLNKVPRYNELFEHYRQEYQYLQQSNAPNLWDKTILDAQSYRQFTNSHITELTRQRFLPQEWPQDMRELLFTLQGDDMLIISQLQAALTFAQLQSGNVSMEQIRNSDSWQTAKTQVESLLKNSEFSLGDFAKWDGFELAVDFYRLRNAGQLALHDISQQRLAQYQFFTELMARSLQQQQSTEVDLNAMSLGQLFSQRFGALFSILDGFRQGQPNDHFMLDLEQGSIKDLD